MLSKILGNYLVSKGKITSEQLEDVLNEITRVRVKLGLIAVAEGMITQQQADKINHLQTVMDKRFGDIAVIKGYLTEKQVDELLKLQGNPYLAFAQALENLNLMNLAELEGMMKEYQVENEFSNSSMEDLKSDDIDRVLPLFLPSDAAEYLGVSGVALRLLMRCVDNNVMPMKAYFDKQFLADKGAMQKVDGDQMITCAFAGKGQTLLPMASYFGHEEFGEVNEDALDAVAELINCINGLYAAEMSQKKVSLELCPPEFSSSINGFYSEKMLVLPLEVYGETVQLLITVEDKLEMR